MSKYRIFTSKKFLKTSYAVDGSEVPFVMTVGRVVQWGSHTYHTHRSDIRVRDRVSVSCGTLGDLPKSLLTVCDREEFERNSDPVPSSF